MMATNSLDSGLDELVTEARYSPDLRLDELSVTLTKISLGKTYGTRNSRSP